MSIKSNVILLAQAIGLDVKDLYAKQGDLTTLTDVTNKTSVVGAISEIAARSASGAILNDTGLVTSVIETWSISKIIAYTDALATTIKDDLTDGAAATLNTLKELADALNNDANFASTVLDALSKRVRFDAAQTLTAPEQDQARTNIAAAGSADFDALVIAVGDTTVDFAAAYAAAKL